MHLNKQPNEYKIGINSLSHKEGILVDKLTYKAIKDRKSNILHIPGKPNKAKICLIPDSNEYFQSLMEHGDTLYLFLQINMLQTDRLFKKNYAMKLRDKLPRTISGHIKKLFGDERQFLGYGNQFFGGFSKAVMMGPKGNLVVVPVMYYVPDFHEKIESLDPDNFFSYTPGQFYTLSAEDELMKMLGTMAPEISKSKGLLIPKEHYREIEKLAIESSPLCYQTHKIILTESIEVKV